MLASDAISIIPDWTLIVQTAIFFLCVGILSLFVFRPILKIIDRRRAFTHEARQESARLTEEAEQLAIGRRKVLDMAIEEAQADRAKRILATQKDADAQVSSARAKAHEIMSAAEISIESKRRSIGEEMEKRAEEIAKGIVRRVVD